ncbi:MAG: hypothetical protein OXF39_06130 [Nitrospira sp.]|nr:hypothetical protein [Nitrospira sp.]
MAEYPYPRWVRERAKCSVSFLFDLLLDAVRQDVDDANSHSPLLTEGYVFYLDVEDKKQEEDTRTRFQVRRGLKDRLTSPHSSDREYITVKFQLMNGGIKISCPHHPLFDSSFWVFSDWNADRQACRLKIGEQIYQPWEISQLTLGYLFFDTLRPSTS